MKNPRIARDTEPTPPEIPQVGDITSPDLDANSPGLTDWQIVDSTGKAIQSEPSDDISDDSE